MNIKLPLISWLMLLIIMPASLCAAEAIPSCYDDIAVKTEKSGSSPVCTPVIVTNKIAMDMLKTFNAKKIKQKWYIFLSEKDFKGDFDNSAKWQTISLFVSAVQTLFSEKADCYIVQIPRNDKEKEALLAGNYPQELIAAAGKLSTPENEIKESDWPEFHHHILYKLTVY